MTGSVLSPRVLEHEEGGVVVAEETSNGAAICQSLEFEILSKL